LTDDFDKIFPDRVALKDLATALELSDIVKINALEPDSTYRINPDDPSWKELYKRYGSEFPELTKHALLAILQKKHQGVMINSTFSDLTVELVANIDIKIHDLSPKIYNTPVTFNCTIISVDARKAFVKEGYYVCPSCGGIDMVKCNGERKILPRLTKCMTAKCGGYQMELDIAKSIVEYIQTVIIQEPLEEARNNSPVSFVAKLVGHKVGAAFTSQTKKITGVFKTSYDNRKIEQDIYIDIVEMEDLEEKKLIKPTDKQIDEYKERAKDSQWMKDLIGSYAPNIFGYEDIKESILLLLSGGTTTSKRGEINILLVGDPSLAKTKLLEFGEKITQKSAYTTGKGATGVGLTIAVIKEENLGRFMATAGVYPLCNGGYVFVDEFDKMNKEDRSSMHEVLESGKCSIAKAGIKLTLPAKVATLAAANPQYGKYDPSLTIADNINLLPTILTRMDMIWLMRDKVNEYEDEKKGRHILAEYEANAPVYKGAFSPNEMLALINYVKELKPVLCSEAKEKLLKMYQTLRRASLKQDTTPVGIRQLEALVRLSMAYTKWHFREVVEMEDIEEVIRIYTASHASYGVDLTEGTIGNATIEDFAKMNKDQKFFNEWRKAEDDKGSVDLISFTHALEGCKQFPNDVDVSTYISKMQIASKILRNADGTYRRNH